MDNENTAYLKPSKNYVVIKYATEDDSYVTIDWGDGNIEQTTSTEMRHWYLGNIDICTVAICGNLTYLDLGEEYSFFEIDVSRCRELTKLRANKNCIWNFDASKNTKLKYLTIGDSYASSINLSNNKELTHLYLDTWFNITTIDLSPLTELKKIKVALCPKLTTIDFTKNLKLTSIDLFGCYGIETVDFSGLSQVTAFKFYDINDFKRLSGIRCVNASTAIYNELTYRFKYYIFPENGTLTTDNSEASEVLRAIAASKGWTVIIE